MIALDPFSTPSKVEAVQAVGIAQCIVTNDPQTSLVSYGLGSCVAIAAYDPVAHVGGLLHVLLPEPTSASAAGTPTRFASTGIPYLLAQIEAQGGLRARLRIVAVGGAQMLGAFSQVGPLKAIGQRNIEVVQYTLQHEQLSLAAADFGGMLGRTIGLVIATGITWVRATGNAPGNL